MSKTYKLGELLPYEQPSKYIVNSTEYDDSYPIPVLTAGKSFILGYTNETNNIFEDLPVIIFDDFTTATQYVDFRFKVKSSAMKILHINTDLVLPKYIYYLLQAIHIEHSTHKRYWIQQFSKVKVDIPPIPEQERIVSQIEESLSQLDSAVETLKKTKQQLEVYRQAVLKEAFQGTYSIKWRKDNTKIKADVDYHMIKTKTAPFRDVSGDENEINLTLPNEWLYLRMGEIFDVEVGSTPSRQKGNYWNGTINWVSSGEVKFNHISSTKERITEEGLKNSSTNLQPVGTVLLAMIGEGKTRGQSAVLDVPAAHNQNTAAILVSKTSCEPKYIYYFLQLNYDHTRRVGSGNNQKALNKERVRALHFPFAPFEEQKIVVAEIEKRLSLCDEIDNTLTRSLQQAEALRQSILKQAFETR